MSKEGGKSDSGVRSYVFAGIGNAVALVSSFAVGVAMARALGPEGRGVVAALQAFPRAVEGLCDLGGRQAVSVSLAGGSGTKDGVIGSGLVIGAVAGTLSFAVSFAAIALFGPAGVPWLWGGLAAANGAVVMFLVYCGAIFAGTKRFRFLGIHYGGAPFLGLVMIALLWALTEVDCGVLLTGILMGNGLFVATCIFYIKNQYEALHVDFRTIRSLLKMGRSYCGLYVVTNASDFAAILILQSLSSSSEVGWFANANGVASLLLQIPLSLSAVLTVRVAAAAENGSRAVVSKTLMWSAGISIVGCIVLILGGPAAIRVVYGSEFARSGELLAVLAPATVALVVFRVLSYWYVGTCNANVVTATSLVGMSFSVLVCVITIPIYGAWGAAMGAATGYVVNAIVLSVLFLYGGVGIKSGIK